MYDFSFFSILSGGILLLAVVDDIASRKIHNKLLLILLPVTLGLLAWHLGGAEFLQHLMRSGITILLSIIVVLPFVLSKIIGAGDLKLLLLLSLVLSPLILFQLFLFSFIWASLLGLAQIVVSGQLPALFSNLMHFKDLKDNKNLHSIPFSVALFFSWSSVVVLKFRFINFLF
ncbi:MAG: hypothetical protein HAW63_02865 [Bdellovibrionaceae bacterium]|nr:hypothetical protein [Pseudobdellovibrionaceae bacterium]